MIKNKSQVLFRHCEESRPWIGTTWQSRRLTLLLAVFLVIIDQLTKLTARTFLQPQINTGSFLGLYIGKFPLFSLLIACLALVVLLSDIIKKKQISFGETIILSGGLSNIIDRGVRSGIVDWINFFGLWFNLADIYITAGVIIVLIRAAQQRKLNESIH